MSGQRLYRNAVRAFSLGFVAIGLLLLAVTLANDGGPVSVGVVMGTVFVALGAARFWISSRSGR